MNRQCGLEGQRQEAYEKEAEGENSHIITLHSARFARNLKLYLYLPLPLLCCTLTAISVHGWFAVS